MDSASPPLATGSVHLPAIKVVSAENARQLEKRCSFLWDAAHRLLPVNAVLANHMIGSMMQLVKSTRAHLPQSVLDFICERCGGVLLPSVSADVRVVSQSRKSRANRRLLRQQRRVQLQLKGSEKLRRVRETLSTLVRIKCHRCEHVTDRAGASKVHKVETTKRDRAEHETWRDTTTIQLCRAQGARNTDDNAQRAVSSWATVELNVVSTSPRTASPAKLPRKLLDGPKKKRKHKKTSLPPNAAVLAVQNHLSSFLQGLDGQK
ncbi:hypothetical protein PsorP6_006540 [Peronosclerospora sorghi]|uniref:Uncharacterized protein n=1 Tax=Peronosclerospora sorghi TaxID=230839 RepID=A0ACC0W6C4_9STRA|nr:hypothetical protein PsorP6_006540 [Peronosclerospora sorghi]